MGFKSQQHESVKSVGSEGALGLLKRVKENPHGETDSQSLLPGIPLITSMQAGALRQRYTQLEKNHLD